MQKLLLLLLILIEAVSAQEHQEQNYQLLLLEMELIESYVLIPADVKSIIGSAGDYAASGDYDMAVVYMEEAISKIKISGSPKKETFTAQKSLKFNMISGMDYNHHEFELGFSQGDSVLIDELTNPYIGLRTEYGPTDKHYKLAHIFRYDRENFQTDLNFLKEIVYEKSHLDISIGGLYDRNFSHDYLGFTEIYSDLYYRGTNYFSDWFWNFKNSIRLKSYKKESESIPDFIRNNFTASVLRNYSYFNTLQFDYGFNLNESLRYRNNDFSEHTAGIKYQNISRELKIISEMRYRYFDYSWVFSDTLNNNAASTLTLAPHLSYSPFEYLQFDILYKADYKSYKFKTEREADYLLNYLNPSATINISKNSSFSLGYVLEDKKHSTSQGLNNQYVEDQNYRSNGIKTDFDYSNSKGFFVSLSAEYTLRRYPDNTNDDSFSLYSNRNILDVLLFAQIPFNDNIKMNIIGSFDNDEDIDIDFNNSISTFFTMELSYAF